MDKKILAAIVVVIVIIAAAATAVALSSNDDDDEKQSDSYINLGRTNEYFPDHTCCVLIANNQWLTSNPDVAARTLAGYVDAMKFLSNALSNPDSDSYKQVVDVISNLLSSANLTDDEIKTALSNISYQYADADDTLNDLKTSIKELVGQLNTVGALTGTVPTGSALDTFVDSYVNDTPLTNALSLTSGKSNYSAATVTIACISGDIHQIGVHLAQDLGFFDNYNISASFEYAANGGGIVTALIQNGAHAQIGVVGAPPATLNTINQDLLSKSSQAYNIIARANSEGSGLYIKASQVDDPSVDVTKLTRNGTAFFTVNSDGSYSLSSANANAWKGLIFGTPGATSIQHIQLGTIANELGLELRMYTEGSSTSDNAIYYVTNIANASQTLSNTVINAGILWEPQYTKILVESSGSSNGTVKATGYIDLGRTNEYFPDHTCCVLIANSQWLNNNSEVAARTLAGYVDAMKFLSNALSNPDSDDYKQVVDVISDLLSSAGLTDSEIRTALSNISYQYADSGDTLDDLKSSIKELVGQLNTVGALTGTVPTGSDLDTFVDSYVNDTPLKNALALTSGATYTTANVTIACISGDIHQIGVHLAQQLGYFANYGINASFEYAANGGGIVTALIQNGAQAQIGVVGAPPATLNTINQDLLNDSSKAYNIIARANSEGSGLYIKASAVDDSTADVTKLTRNGTAFFTVNSDGSYSLSSANANAWKGLVFGTPGSTSIQHIQLGTIANELGLELRMYTAGASTSANAIYYVTNISNASLTLSNNVINAGILWEPQYTKILEES